ncbi:alpha/beta hydrolase [Frondihabitans cladoniiphilus]|uniref:Esterase n=1 Tax=Frondihabitans cladoniiphilus TaxID=715785 RepID=A0ABP8VNA3_9MICO
MSRRRAQSKSSRRSGSVVGSVAFAVASAVAVAGLVFGGIGLGMGSAPGGGSSSSPVSAHSTATPPAAQDSSTATPTAPAEPVVPPIALGGADSVRPTPDLGAPGAVTVAGAVTTKSLYRTWKPPRGMPSVGTVTATSIPGTASGFVARPAEIYRPPAALVANAPALPVVILLSGQPASPESVIEVGSVEKTLDVLAAVNHGLAPIVVVPDQLGQPQDNPMCVDGPLGNAATYVMTDVVGWIRANLHVADDRDSWAVGGFSEGGTCSLQFAAAHPDVFGALVDVSGEEAPSVGTIAATIARGFRGSRAAYEAALPTTLLRAHTPYSDEVGLFAVGGTDTHYGPIMQEMSGAAAASGIQVARYLSPNSGHNWTTATNGFAAGLGMLYPRFGLAAAGQYLPAATQPG